MKSNNILRSELCLFTSKFSVIVKWFSKYLSFRYTITNLLHTSNMHVFMCICIHKYLRVHSALQLHVVTLCKDARFRTHPVPTFANTQFGNNKISTMAWLPLMDSLVLLSLPLNFCDPIYSCKFQQSGTNYFF